MNPSPTHLSIWITYHIPQTIERCSYRGESHCSAGCEFVATDDDMTSGDWMCTLFDEWLFEYEPCAKCNAALEAHMPYQELLRP